MTTGRINQVAKPLLLPLPFASPVLRFPMSATSLARALGASCGRFARYSVAPASGFALPPSPHTHSRRVHWSNRRVVKLLAIKVRSKALQSGRVQQQGVWRTACYSRHSATRGGRSLLQWGPTSITPITTHNTGPTTHWRHRLTPAFHDTAHRCSLVCRFQHFPPAARSPSPCLLLRRSHCSHPPSR